MKAYRIIHTAANITAFGLLGAMLIYFLFSYEGLPERIGIHFSAVDGQLDVYSYKIFGFYPFVMGFGLLGIFSLLSLAVKKIKKLGLKITEKGDTVFRCTAVLLLDLIKLLWAVFFSFWTYCIVHQTGMGDGTPLDIFRVFFIILLLSVPVFFSEIQVRYRSEPRQIGNADDAELPEKKRKLFKIQHIAANIIAFGSLGTMLVYFLLSYGGLPERIGIHFGSEGNFDVYSYKVFGFYPFAAGFGLLLIFSLLTIAVKKIKHIGMSTDKQGEQLIRMIIVEALDVLKIIWAAFFSVWSYCVIHQTGLPMIFVGIITFIFLALLPVAAIVIVITARGHRTKDLKEKENDNITRN